EVCAGLDATRVAKVLHERGILERAADGYLKQHWVGGRNLRAYTITARILVSLNIETGVRGVNVVRTDTSDGVPTAENCANTKGLTPLTPLTPQTHTEQNSKATGDVSERDPDGWSFNTEDDGLEIPGFLKRGSHD